MPFPLNFTGSIVMLVMVLVPIVASAWALVTLARLRTAQEEVLQRLDSIEKRLREMARASSA